jgi:hypothetical protein
MFVAEVGRIGGNGKKLGMRVKVFGERRELKSAGKTEEAGDLHTPHTLLPLMPASCLIASTSREGSSVQSRRAVLAPPSQAISSLFLSLTSPLTHLSLSLSPFSSLQLPPPP